MCVIFCLGTLFKLLTESLTVHVILLAVHSFLTDEETGRTAGGRFWVLSCSVPSKHQCITLGCCLTRTPILTMAGLPTDCLPLQVNSYAVPRMRFYQLIYAATQANDYAAMLPWQLLPWHVDPARSGGYDYGTDDPTYLGPIVQAQNYQTARVRALESNYRGNCAS